MQIASDAPATFRSSARRPSTLDLVTTAWHEVLSRRRLIRYLVRAQIKKQGTDTVLGNVWWILDPLISLMVYVFVMTFIFDRKQDDFPVFLLAAMIPFKWFTGDIAEACNSVTTQGALIKQIQFPKIVLPIVTNVAGLVNLGFGMLILVVVVALLYPAHLSITLLWVPVIAAIQLLLMIGLSLIVSALCVFYRDVGIVMGHLLRLLFYMAPILWTFDAVSGRGSALEKALGPVGFRILRYNPVAILMESYRTAVYGVTAKDGINWEHADLLSINVTELAGVLVLSIALLLVGVVVFKRLEPAFAKVL